MDNVMKAGIIKFLRQINGDDGDNTECDGKPDCPTHSNCGQCAFEYMEKKGWLHD